MYYLSNACQKLWQLFKTDFLRVSVREKIWPFTKLHRNKQFTCPCLKTQTWLTSRFVPQLLNHSTDGVVACLSSTAGVHTLQLLCSVISCNSKAGTPALNQTKVGPVGPKLQSLNFQTSAGVKILGDSISLVSQPLRDQLRAWGFPNPETRKSHSLSIRVPLLEPDGWPQWSPTCCVGRNGDPGLLTCHPSGFGSFPHRMLPLQVGSTCFFVLAFVCGMIRRHLSF